MESIMNVKAPYENLELRRTDLGRLEIVASQAASNSADWNTLTWSHFTDEILEQAIAYAMMPVAERETIHKVYESDEMSVSLMYMSFNKPYNVVTLFLKDKDKRIVTTVAVTLSCDNLVSVLETVSRESVSATV